MKFGLILTAGLLIFGQTVMAKQPFTATEQAMWGLQLAGDAADSCPDDVKWVETTAGRMNVRLGYNVLRSEGHKNGALAKARKTKGAGPYVLFDGWLKQAGYKPNQSNIEKLVCEFALKVAGTDHPMGRFLVRK
jgi:hypothetical protein